MRRYEVQWHEVESQLIGWRLNASATDWVHVDMPEAEQEGKRRRFFRQLYRTRRLALEAWDRHVAAPFSGKSRTC